MGGDDVEVEVPPWPECAWHRCERDATVLVLAGDLLRRRRRRHGVYCAAHAVEVSRRLRARATVDVWFSVIRHDREGGR